MIDLENCYPDEACTKPLPLVTIVGLSTAEDSLRTVNTDRALLDAFLQRRLKAEDHKIRFAPIPSLDSIVPSKTKDRVEPNLSGLIKSNWIFKHMHLIPAVVVTFVRLVPGLDTREADSALARELQQQRFCNHFTT